VLASVLCSGAWLGVSLGVKSLGMKPLGVNSVGVSAVEAGRPDVHAPDEHALSAQPSGEVRKPLSWFAYRSAAFLAVPAALGTCSIGSHAPLGVHTVCAPTRVCAPRRVCAPYAVGAVYTMSMLICGAAREGMG
jgi:hypothetical protein